jgi:hypothetical protein
MCRRQTKFMS